MFDWGLQKIQALHFQTNLYLLIEWIVDTSYKRRIQKEIKLQICHVDRRKSQTKYQNCFFICWYFVLFWASRNVNKFKVCKNFLYNSFNYIFFDSKRQFVLESPPFLWLPLSNHLSIINLWFTKQTIKK